MRLLPREEGVSTSEEQRSQDRAEPPGFPGRFSLDEVELFA